MEHLPRSARRDPSPLTPLHSPGALTLDTSPIRWERAVRWERGTRIGSLWTGSKKFYRVEFWHNGRTNEVIDYHAQFSEFGVAAAVRRFGGGPGRSGVRAHRPGLVLG